MFSMYFMDSGAYTNDTKKEYDYIQQDQLDWLLATSKSFENARLGTEKPNAMVSQILFFLIYSFFPNFQQAFFHLPIW